GRCPTILSRIAQQFRRSCPCPSSTQSPVAKSLSWWRNSDVQIPAPPRGERLLAYVAYRGVAVAAYGVPRARPYRHCRQASAPLRESWLPCARSERRWLYRVRRTRSSDRTACWG